jgi:ribonuclease D
MPDTYPPEPDVPTPEAPQPKPPTTEVSATEPPAKTAESDEAPTEPTREQLAVPAEHETILIEASEALKQFAAHIGDCSLVAVDTEANSMHAYREQTCIMQITAGGRSAIIDVLAVEDLGPIREALDRPDVEIIFHGGDYDITVLSRDHNFAFELVFDTMIAATLLGDQRVGLAALVEDHFGHALNKRYQRADWARRPLTEEQLDYLRRDTMYLSSLHAHYTQRLAEADLTEEADIEFRRLATRQGKPHVFDPESWRRIKGVGRLDDRGRCVLRPVFLWRESIAEQRDVPPFKVLAPQAMLALSERCKSAPQAPRDLHGLNDGLRRRYGSVLMDLVRTGLADFDAGKAPKPTPRGPASTDDAKLSRVQRKREELLKDWRRKEARKRDVPNLVVLPNPALMWLARERPESVPDLAACADIGPKRTERYGETWVRLLLKS